ncbi:MAG: 16S rRNA (guanine(966)-N(2))-methyltransferase RsmD [Pyrinomonadaceae bacterium]
MRIISGLYGGRVLKSPSDQRTRPTSDRLRETLFSILAPRIDESTRFLDLCAGTGAIGIEALSRGGKFAAFVDKSRRACALIEENLDLLTIPENATDVFCFPAVKFLSKYSNDIWDIIYFDPPYSERYDDVLSSVGEKDSKCLSETGIFIAEHHSKNNLPDTVGELRRWRLLNQGENCLSFYEKN